jgi:hypothetical protein
MIVYEHGTYEGRDGLPSIRYSAIHRGWALSKSNLWNVFIAAASRRKAFSAMTWPGRYPFFPVLSTGKSVC